MKLRILSQISRLPALAALRVALLICLSALAHPCCAAALEYFRISVQDAETGRGVPLVELRTVNEVRYYTDSNGIAAINDPELLGENVYFRVSSPGYDVPADNFGYHDTALQVTAGGSAIIKIKRTNIAERLYRITGAGIYRDSVLTGQPVPLKEPLLNGRVMGQDTVMAAVYEGKLVWFYGDTNRPSYPLGQSARSRCDPENMQRRLENSQAPIKKIICPINSCSVTLQIPILLTEALCPKILWHCV